MIEGMDIANLGGQASVGSLVKFIDGRPFKEGYRRFKIKTVTGIDDYAMIRQTFFEHPILEHHLRHDFLELSVLGPQKLDLATRRFAHRVAVEALLTGLEKVLRPSVVQVRRDPLSSAQLGNAHLSAQTLKNNSNLFFGGKSAASTPPNLTHGRFT